MAAPRIVGPHDGHMVFLGGADARFLVDGDDTGDIASPLSSIRCGRVRLARPCTGNHREDEYSFILEGTMGAQLGDAVVIGLPGDLIFKPRNQWHTFWNAGDAPARILEIISPAVENYFRELGVELAGSAPDPQRLVALCGRYELDMDMASVPGLMSRFGVRFYEAAG